MEQEKISEQEMRPAGRRVYSRPVSLGWGGSAIIRTEDKLLL